MSKFKNIDQVDIDFFINTIGNENVIVDSNLLHEYSKDYTEDLVFAPQVALLPKDEYDIGKILAYCNQHLIAVTPRGAGTGLSGAALPIFGGLVISTKRLNQILAIDLDNFQIITQPGVINQHIKDELAKHDLAYPPDPASKGSCFIGGNIAHSSGGPQALKYGTTKDYVLNLQVVLADGSIIWTGANTLKNSTGYNLTQLMVGSEGTLGIVTQIVLKTIPLSKYKTLMVAGFDSISDACKTVSPLFLKGLQPAAVELLDAKGVAIVCDKKAVSNPFPAAQCYLMIEFDGNEPQDFTAMCEKAYEICLENAALEVLLAESSEEQEVFWNIRRSIGEVVKMHSIYKEEDTVVPRSNLPQVIEKVSELEKAYGFSAICYGHAGDGNLHINILKENLDDDVWNNQLPIAIRSLFEECKVLGGTISGEHGIGYVQKQYMDVMMTPIHFSLMQGIKKVFDPNGIMNPGKIFD